MTSLAAMFMLFGFTLYLHFYQNGFLMFTIGLLTLVGTMAI
jgi:hypothetical protein